MACSPNKFSCECIKAVPQVSCPLGNGATSSAHLTPKVRQRRDSSGGFMQTNDQPKDARSPGYSAEIAETICDRLVNGESLRAK